MIPLIGLPNPINVPTRGKVYFSPYKPAHEAARLYMQSVGAPYVCIKHYREVEKRRAALIAGEYDRMTNDPNDPAVSLSYDALAKETLAQFGFIEKTGLVVEFAFDDDPYKASPLLAILDVVENNHLWVTSTLRAYGFGGAVRQKDVENNPMLANSGVFFSKVPACVNDLFRAVHDYFGHVRDGISFFARGEENAWRSHSFMYSRTALGAITTELRGQNSWANFGPFGDFNRKANVSDTIYADQKIGLLPEWCWDEGRSD